MKYYSTLDGNLFKQNYSDAGLDICSSMYVVIKPGESALISTGLYLEIDEGYVGILKSRSGLSVKYNLEVGAGVIDSSYRGEVKVHLYNFGKTDYFVMPKDRICQLLTIPISLDIYDKVHSLDELTETIRGIDGFGSTGVRGK